MLSPVLHYYMLLDSPKLPYQPMRAPVLTCSRMLLNFATCYEMSGTVLRDVRDSRPTSARRPSRQSSACAAPGSTPPARQ
eukprot:367439-Rhodomonas_salina.1